MVSNFSFDNALELSNVCKSYRDFSLKDVTFSLPRGSIMGFIGENGAGKTTTIKAILNLISIEQGEIAILGHDHKQEERAAKEEVGVVFDEGYFHGTLRPREIGSIMKNIYKSWDSVYYAELLRKFSLSANKPFKDFSKGMRMKLSIATALAHHPRLLILDEATSGLDPMMRSEILDMLLEFIQDEEHSVLLSSHITSDLEKVADYITFIHQGRIIFSESKDDLLDRYGMLKCGRDEYARISHEQIIGCRESAFGVEALVRDRDRFQSLHRGLTVDPVSIEEIMLYYGKSGDE